MHLHTKRDEILFVQCQAVQEVLKKRHIIHIRYNTVYINIRIKKTIKQHESAAIKKTTINLNQNKILYLDCGDQMKPALLTSCLTSVMVSVRKTPEPRVGNCNLNAPHHPDIRVQQSKFRGILEGSINISPLDTSLFHHLVYSFFKRPT